jgi:hypothetical protein
MGGAQRLRYWLDVVASVLTVAVGAFVVWLIMFGKPGAGTPLQRPPRAVESYERMVSPVKLS